MKSWKIVCMMALALVMLFALPALASEVTETAPDPVNCEEGGEHEFAPETVWDVTKPATCTEVGSQQAVCSKCGKLVVREIPTTEHTFTVLVSEEVPASCTTPGTTAVYKCEYCDARTGGETIPENGHTFTVLVSEETPATCTTPGTTAVYKCAYCEETKGGETIPETGHTFNVLQTPETPATCTTPGTTAVYKCAYCEETTGGDPIPETGHTFNVPVSDEVPATCTTTGTTAVFKCAYCEETTGGETIPVDPNAHVWDDGKVTKDPTCTEEGERTYTCTLCQTTRTEAVAAAGHKWGSWVTTKEATEDEDGEQTRTCSVCGATQTRTVEYDGTMPETGVFTLPTALLAGVLALSLTGYVALKRKAVRG